MGDSAELMKRLAALNGRPLEHVPPVRPPDPPRRPVASRPFPPVLPSAPTTGLHLTDLVPGAETAISGWGCAYQVVTRAQDLLPGSEGLCRSFYEGLSDSPIAPHLFKLCHRKSLSAEETIFLDLETCGLSRSPLFLCGMMAWENGTLLIRQFLARHYGEEAAVTAMLLENLRGRRLLVSFNGRSFDLPFLKARAAIHGVPCPRTPPHLDLLHEARHAWRGYYPDCKLQTLEQFLCGRVRSGDIPGREIPQAYDRFVRTGNAAQIAAILRHNALDILTLAELLMKLPARL